MTASDIIHADRPLVPPVLYVPRDGQTTDGDTVVLDYRTTRDGRTALLAYTALDRLVDCCGDRQAWVLIETSALDDIAEQQPYDLILLDITTTPSRFRRRRTRCSASGTRPRRRACC
jgi:hypothetical protein